MNKETFMAEAGLMYEELSAWRATHTSASFDEIASQVTQKRQKLMGELLGRLAEQEGKGEFLLNRSCPKCEGVMHYKGEKKREVEHPEGQPTLWRGYHHCDHCGHGFFPSR
jgi:hypothetical protein